MRQLGRFLRIALVMLCCLFAAIAQTQQPGPEQPIPFSHQLHAGALELECATCHKNPDPGERMGLATAPLCLECHSGVKADSPSIKKLAAFGSEKRAIGWVRVYEIPSFVSFSHRAHLAEGASCTECHGDVKTMERMYRAKDVSMKSCVDCHQRKGASVDCGYCHEKM